METITNGHKKTMGETGAGITRAEEIDMSQTNGFTNKWGMYLEVCTREKKPSNSLHQEIKGTLTKSYMALKFIKFQ